MLEIIITYKLYILLSPFVALMLYDFMQEGMIFEMYGRWVRHEQAIEDITAINKKLYENGIKEGDNDIKSKLLCTDVPKYKYPLGYCIKCFGFWIIVIYVFLPYSEFVLFTILVGCSYSIIALWLAARIQ